MSANVSVGRVVCASFGLSVRQIWGVPRQVLPQGSLLTQNEIPEYFQAIPDTFERRFEMKTKTKAGQIPRRTRAGSRFEIEAVLSACAEITARPAEPAALRMMLAESAKKIFQAAFSTVVLRDVTAAQNATATPHGAEIAKSHD